MALLLLEIFQNLEPTVLSRLRSDLLVESISNYQSTLNFFNNVEQILKKTSGKIFNFSIKC